MNKNRGRFTPTRLYGHPMKKIRVLKYMADFDVQPSKDVCAESKHAVERFQLVTFARIHLILITKRQAYFAVRLFPIQTASPDGVKRQLLSRNSPLGMM